MKKAESATDYYQARENVYEQLKPEMWFFGHFHKPFEGSFENTQFVALDMCNIETGNYDLGFYYNVDI